MIGSAAIAAFIAQSAFWALLMLGLVSQELGRVTAGVFVAIWLIASFGLPHVTYGSAYVAPFVAVLDIVLVFLIFKGDVRLT